MTTGRNSQFALTRLASKYLQMNKDGRLLSNRDSLAIVRRRIVELAERIDLNQAPDRLENLCKLWDDYKRNRSGPNEILTRALLDEEFEKAYHDYAAWRQMFDAIDLDRKLVESEVKIIKEIRAVMTAEDGMKLAAQLQAAVIATVNGLTDTSDHQKKYIVQRIQYEFTRIVGDTNNEGVRGSGGEDSDAGSSDVDRVEFPDPGDEA